MSALLSKSAVLVSRPAVALNCRAISSGGKISIPVPEFSTDRRNRRMDSAIVADRGRLFYWNLSCIGLTAVPVGFLLWGNFGTVCEESEQLARVAAPLSTRDARLFAVSR
eukprot:GHVS01026511.1.p1 GENE.GHVS01026511.1~~GHVS01026511.1.p1  ORF type:complete len:110 (-),score=15.35 GHVS01026511.1:441-770(-)